MTLAVANYLYFSLQLNYVLLDMFLDVIQLVVSNGVIRRAFVTREDTKSISNFKQ